MKKNSASSHRTGLTIALLAAVLAVLFWRSFLPGYVHFNNDGPLGQQNVNWAELPGGFTGMWDDLNDVGYGVGTFSPTVSILFKWVVGPVGYAKFYAPFALLILGLGAWTFFRALKFSPAVTLLGALAAMLNSAYLGNACWGVASGEIAIGFDFMALALVIANTTETPRALRWTRLALAGLCVGVNIMEGADIGALLSIIIAAFVFLRELVKDFIPLSKRERIIIVCFVNLVFCLLLTLVLIFGPRMGLDMVKLCLLSIVLIVAAAIINWSLIRPLVSLSKKELFIALTLVNLGCLLVFIFGILHGYGFFILAGLLIAAMALNWALLYYPLFVNRSGLGIVHLGVISLFAAFLATQFIFALVSTFIIGVAGTSQDSETKSANWDYATQWSLPKKESLGLIVPGLFGYKMDTPQGMWPSLQKSYQGGVYWGGMGRTPEIDRFFDSRAEGNPPPGIMRFSGGGEYCGILVALIAAWAVAQAFRRNNSVFTPMQRKLIWFWAGVLFLSLLFAWGRFAPFYAFLYKLPYFSTIRNPAKFVIFFCWALIILFGYGMQALHRRQLETAATGTLLTQLKNWWSRASGFDRRWTFISFGICAASVVGLIIFSSEKSSFVQYLQKTGYADETFARQIAAFSLNQTSWFILLFAVALALVTLVIAGYFSGPRVKPGIVLLGGFLLLDLGRSDLPYIIHWDYKLKYETDSLNPVLKKLSDKSYEHRVAGLPFDAPRLSRPYNNYFSGHSGVYSIEWMQHHFPYYNIQCLDLIQMSRMPEDLKSYLTALAPKGTPESVPLIARRWELSNTRYLLGAAGYVDVMNQQLDPVQHRFRLADRFDVITKPGVELKQLEDLTVALNPEGELGLIEFTGALPRARLFSNWQVNTNDPDVLKTLADLSFDPWKTVLISTPGKNLAPVATNENSGSVEYKNYSPKQISLAARAAAPSVLLLNDKFDPHWSVTVDGQPAELLRCNFLMRGVYLDKGDHTVEFFYRLPNLPMYFTLAAMGTGIFLLALLVFLQRKSQNFASK